MATSRRQNPRYHHGDLRRALLDAARELVREEGVDGTTLRAISRRAGVSHAAPAHHFADKAALVEALAVEGFADFTVRLQEGWDNTEGHCLERLMAVGLAYVRFAQEERELFRIMNRPELRSGEGGWGSPVGQAAHETFAVLERAIEECQAQGIITPGNTRPWAMLAWSGVHGLAMLILDGLTETRITTPDEGAEMTRMVLLAMGHGLFARPAAPAPGDGRPSS